MELPESRVATGACLEGKIETMLNLSVEAIGSAD